MVVHGRRRVPLKTSITLNTNNISEAWMPMNKKHKKGSVAMQTAEAMYPENHTTADCFGNNVKAEQCY